jgi:pimeloyl-ACP methyl ester carboxylesterase
VWGEHDGIVTPDYGRAFSRMIPQARFAIVEQAGHYPHLEQPAKFLTLVQDFL